MIPGPSHHILQRAWRTFALLSVFSMTTPPNAFAAPASATPPASSDLPSTNGARRAPGPAGSLIMVEETRGLPIVSVLVAARTGSASDGPGKEGLANFAAELARRGAGGRGRAAIDDALDALGASLEVDIEPDSIRFAGQVLVRNLDPFLDILASILLAPDFNEAELVRTRDELLEAGFPVVLCPDHASRELERRCQ